MHKIKTWYLAIILLFTIAIFLIFTPSNYIPFITPSKSEKPFFPAEIIDPYFYDDNPDSTGNSSIIPDIQPFSKIGFKYQLRKHNLGRSGNPYVGVALRWNLDSVKNKSYFNISKFDKMNIAINSKDSGTYLIQFKFFIDGVTNLQDIYSYFYRTWRINVAKGNYNYEIWLRRGYYTPEIGIKVINRFRLSDNFEPNYNNFFSMDIQTGLIDINPIDTTKNIGNISFSSITFYKYDKAFENPYIVLFCSGFYLISLLFIMLCFKRKKSNKLTYTQILNPENETTSRKLVTIFEDITSRLLESSEPNRLYNVAVKIAMETTDAQACSLYLERNIADPDRLASRIVMVAGAGFEYHRIGVSYEKGQGLTGSIWKTSESVKLDSQMQIEDPSIGWHGLHNEKVISKDRSWRSYSLIGVPLKIGKRTIGVLKVENKMPGVPAYFKHDDQTLLETIASTIVMAIENQRLFEQTHGNILDALQDMTKILVSPDVMSFRMMCDRIVQKCIDIFNAEACSLYIQSERLGDFIEMASGAGYERLRRGARYKKGVGLTGTIWSNGQPVRYDTRQEVENSLNGWRGLNNNQVKNQRNDWECHSLIGVPLLIGTRTIGVLKVENKKPVKASHFTHNELRTLAIVALNISLALEMRRQEEIIFTKGERAREFAHDVRNEVGTAGDALFAASAAAKESRAIPLVVERISIATNAMDRIEKLRKRLLDSSQSGARRQTVSLNTLLERIKERANVLDSVGIKLESSLFQPDVYAQIDVDEVLRAFDKLLENSIDAIKDIDSHLTNNFKVWILGKRSDHKDKVNILFVDNGPGFTLEQRKDFEQNRDIKSTKHIGFGRGLELSHRCLADNDIYLRIIDPPKELVSQGAAFELTIPTHAPRQLRVLVIDDQETWLELVRSTIKEDTTIALEIKTSYDLILNAGNGGSHALTELAQFDLILLDCQFTGLPYNGPELIQNLQDRDPILAKKVVLMSREPEYINKPNLYVINKTDSIINLPQLFRNLHDRIQ